MRRGQRPREAGRVRVFVPILVFISVGLLLLSRLNHSTLTDARWRVAEWMSPVLKAAMVPLQPLRQVGRDIAAQVDLAAELQNLKTENGPVLFISNHQTYFADVVAMIHVFNASLSGRVD